ncbi:MAG: hypothetical protein CVU61_03735 [Deltaproteobacteria bacterium HGW-Deltaproteobacteria-19]|jgi:hypothetical protein|nr:MAG: hypothetical protein CVU61_03735 [Deltaproteobacteria bacterium HGW-Deltaproteobacteria-19]
MEKTGEKMVSWDLFDELYHASFNAIRRIRHLSGMTTNAEAVEVMDIVDVLIGVQKKDRGYLE